MGINAIKAATGFTFVAMACEGSVEVPKGAAKAVLHGLATGQHWWIYNGAIVPTEAEYTNTQKTILLLLEEGVWANQEKAAFWQPDVNFSTNEKATWKPWSGEQGKSVSFSFEGERCLVEWRSNKKSSFIGGALWALGAHEKISLREI